MKRTRCPERASGQLESLEKFKSWEKFKIVIEMSWEHGARAGTHDGLRRQGERRGPDLESLKCKWTAAGQRKEENMNIEGKGMWD